MRVSLIAVLLSLAGCAVTVRLVQLQWFSREKLAEHASRQRTVVETIAARPGDIIDRNGRLLATTIAARSLYVVPDAIDKPADVAKQLADALGLDADKLRERLDRYKDKQFLWIKRRISEDEAAAIRRLKLAKGAWGFRDEYLRKYPQGAVAAHVLGLRDIDGVGHGGLEEKLDDVLRGTNGKRVLVRDARGRVIGVEDEHTESPQHGRTVVLAIDTVVQLFAEQELEAAVEQWKPKNACVTVMDPKTNDVLAMASWPTFDPNNPAGVAENAWKNNNISSVYEPGSTFKPFVVAWGIQKGVIAAEDEFDCEHGAYKMGRRTLHDHHHYGMLNVTDILVKSSNIGMAKIGEKLSNRGLYEATRVFGFGHKTGSGLPGELDGIVRPFREWNSYSTGSIPMGQELAVTPLQMITAHAALANGGNLMSPRLVLRHAEPLSDPTSRGNDVIEPASVVSNTVDAKTAHWLIEGPMTEVVSRGTGKKAQLIGYTAFGKTGTAQKPDPKTGGYSNQLHVSSFFCGAPAHDPRALVLVVLDEPSVGDDHYGGSVAAPTAANILRRTLVHLRVPAEESQKSAAKP